MQVSALPAMRVRGRQAFTRSYGLLGLLDED
jgi:hypothetical protein